MKRLLLVFAVLLLVGCGFDTSRPHTCFDMKWDHDEGSYYSGKTTKRFYRGETIKVCDYLPTPTPDVFK